MDLKTFFKENPKVALGFSGGVDSAYLLYAAKYYEADVRPYFIKTVFQPQFELEDAKRLAEQLEVELFVIEQDILCHESVAENPADRCYHCKSVLFGTLQKQAKEDGYAVLIDGTNASDDSGDRPGMRVLKELSVKSPLRLCGLTKTQVRSLSKEAGLFTWDKPAYACLATRVPTDAYITEEQLKKVEKAENFLFKKGFSDFRVRLFSNAARLQLTPEQFMKAAEMREEIVAGLKPIFPVVLLDMEGR